MKTTAWRITAPKYANIAFDGEGARLHGGRWNSKGIPMVYLANSRALAAMELLVHISSHQALENYLIIPVEFDSKWVLSLGLEDIPRNWANRPAPQSTKNIGNEWISRQASLILKVPNVLFPEESNYLMNPFHKDFSKLDTEEKTVILRKEKGRGSFGALTH